MHIYKLCYYIYIIDSQTMYVLNSYNDYVYHLEQKKKHGYEIEEKIKSVTYIRKKI